MPAVTEMHRVRHTVYHEYRWDIERMVVRTRSGVFEITEVRALLDDDPIDRYMDITFYGYLCRADGVRRADAAFGLATGLDVEFQFRLEEQVYEWLGLEKQP